jgi:hypothetical protein
MKNLVYTVKLNGYNIKNFNDKVQAASFMIKLQQDQQDKITALRYLDEAVLKSDLKEANEVLSYIMEK